MSNATRNAVNEALAAMDAQFLEERKRQDAERRRQQMEASMQKFDDSILALTDRAVEATMTRGKEDSITVLLMNFLEVAIEMKETMKTLESINGAMQCVTDAIEFLDSAVSMDQLMIETTMQHKYGFFSRMKQQAQIRRAVRNHRNRMKQIMDNLSMKMEMAQSMVSIMKEFSVSMQQAAQKKKKKKGGAEPAPIIASRAADMVAARAQATGVDLGLAPTPAVTEEESGAAGSGTGGVDIFPHSN